MMWLFTTTGPAAEWDAKGETIATTLNKIGAALDALAKPETTFRALTEMDNMAKTLQRTMSSGMVFEADNFREQLFKSYEQTLAIGGTFEDITEAVGGFSEGMNKVVFMTSDMTKNGETFASSLVAMEKSTNKTSKELGTMTSEFMRLEGSQIKSIERMQDIARTARLSGVQSNKLLDEVKGSLSKVDSYGFKGGVDGLTKMATQAQLLRTSVDEIGALSKAQDFWDPEKAIETAANLQMLGGAIGDLGNPYKLMNMGMNDVGELQDQMTKLAANAFKINKETGEIDIDPLSRQRLKAQAELFGKTLEDYTKIGREAKKAQEVMNTMSQTSFGEGMPKESKDLLASLTEFKGGKMTLDIPGFKTDDLESAMVKSPELLQQALESYQKTADMSDRQIAEKGLTLSETLNKDARIIRDTLLIGMGKGKRDDIISNFEKGIDIMATNTKVATEQGVSIASAGLNNIFGQIDESSKKSEISATEAERRRLNEENRQNVMIRDATINAGNVNVNNNGGGAPNQDTAFSTGSKVLSLGKGEMFNFIPEDEAVFAPKLLQKLDFLKNIFLGVQDFTANLPTTFNPPKMEMNNPIETSIQQKTTKQEIVETQKVEASGDINININVNTSGALSDALMKDRNFTQDLKTRVMNIIKDKTKFSAEKGQVG
jgi:hypothetical protein